MLLTLFAFLMKFVDISKMHSHRIRDANCPKNATCTERECSWQHVAGHKATTNKLLQHQQSNSSSTSSGCDSTASSKENYCLDHPQHLGRVSSQQQHHSLTPEQLRQIRYHQYMKQLQLRLLQHKLLQRRRQQEQLRAQDSRQNSANPMPLPQPTLTCNQQYLRQLRLQQQQQQQQQQHRELQFRQHPPYDSDALNNNVKDKFYMNNNDNNNGDIGICRGAPQGQEFRRGMTEVPTSNDISHKSHHSQPLHNSPRHHYHPHQNFPKHFANINNKQFGKKSPSSHINHANQGHQTNHKNHASTQQSALPLTATATATATTSAPTSAPHSPLHHYRNPLNSPSNSPYSPHAIYNGDYHQLQLANAVRGAPNLRGHKLPLQQHLNDLLLQHQQLQQQQQQILLNSVNSGGGGVDSSARGTVAGAANELSEESLKQNVAIVLSNLDRYNNALRSIILSEQVNSCASTYHPDDILLDNNNFLVGSDMATATPATPEADFNSNATPAIGTRISCAQQQPQQHGNMVGFATGAVGNSGGGGGGVGGGVNGVGNALKSSLASSHDFTHDNSDYQWFLDYGYRDGCGGLQRSVLSSLSASYNGIGDLIYYEDLAKNLDANLAEVDMESFRAEDIHSLLSHLPSYCKSLGAGNNHQFHQSLMMQQNMLPHAAAQYAQNIMSQMSNTSANELIDNSICKSELLFSPVKESHISVDSLDMDAYPEDGDIILTCKANKDNYTIAFEGSMMYSDDSFYEPTEIARNKQNCMNLQNNLDNIVKPKSMDISMSYSEQALASRKLPYRDGLMQLQRYPSGNNNNTSDTITIARSMPHCLVRKSSSLPNLCSPSHLSHMAPTITSSTLDPFKFRGLLPMCQIPMSLCNSTNSASISDRVCPRSPQKHQQSQQQLIQQQQQQQQHHHHHHHHHHQQQQQQQGRHKHRCSCSNSSSSATAVAAPPTSTHTHANAHISGSASSANSNPPAFNLVKLFIKQKSSNCSSEEQMSAHTCMDVSSGCWPSSDAAGSSSSSSLEQRLRKKSMNDSGKGSALSRHDEEEHVDESAFGSDHHTDHSTPKRHLLRPRSEALFYDEDPSSSSSGSLTATASVTPTATNSPAHRRRSMPLRHPQLNNLMAKHVASGLSTTAVSQLSSEASRSASEPVTQLYLSSASTAGSGGEKARSDAMSRRVSTASSSEMVTRSMQTSCGSLSTTRSSLSERFRCVPPSFLEKLNNLGQERQAPIYVIYPSYALPDLGFVKTASAASAEVIFSPFNYKASLGSDSSSGSGSACSSSSTAVAALKKRISKGSDDEILKTLDFKHVVDWQSLGTLLPAEYRRRLKHIPEISKLMHDLDSELAQRPLFCMMPSVRRQRPNICDCAKYFQQRQSSAQSQGGDEGGTSSSSSSQQPSSGYRGSSTLLTDSDAVENASALKQMYVYQYDQPRLDSGVEMSPVVSHRAAAGPSQPMPMPRGILRKTQATGGRVKRNSMIEDQQAKQSKLEKRRSLQEPPYQHAAAGGSSEELGGVFEEERDDLYAVPQSRKERLSRKELDARIRAENFLSSLPRSELKHYAEIAAILESESCENQVQYDAVALKKEVSRALSQQKKVSFDDKEKRNEVTLAPAARQSRFTTPPNSPNISIATGGRAAYSAPRRTTTTTAPLDENDAKQQEQQSKIESNRFKRLQIQWELMSKESSMVKELAQIDHTKSGGSTPTSATSGTAMVNKSRIPRPVSYPAGKISTHESGKTSVRSPSRILPPKRYSMASSPGTKAPTTPSPTALTTPPARARTPNSRLASTAPSTPKRALPSPRTIPRVR